MSTKPTWDDLTEDDRARVIYFGRTAEGEGYYYAHENYSVEGQYDHDGLDDRTATELYGRHEDGLPIDEWWRLYDKGEELSRATAVASAGQPDVTDPAGRASSST